LIRFRRAHPALRVGAIAFLDAPDDVLAFTRVGAGEHLLCLFNLGAREGRFALPAAMSVTALEGHGFAGLADGRTVVLPPGEAFFADVV
jgi:alpha-glucosidase